MNWAMWMAVAALVASAGSITLRIGKRRWKFAASGFAFILFAMAVVALGISIYLAWWFCGRSSAVAGELFQGIEYQRVLVERPARFVAHVVFVDLRATNLSFVVTRGEPGGGGSLKASTVGDFLEREKVQLAVNANFFDPFHSKSPWDYYPKSGDPIRTLGMAAARGNVYSTQVWAGATIYFSDSNRVQMGGGVEKIWNAIAGDQWLVRGGTNVAKEDRFGRYTRAGIGLNAAADRLIIATIDGKQPGYSEGATLPEFAELMRSHGAFEAVNLDGGGSVTLVVEGEDGKPRLLNSPIHTRIPGRQRPVANQLGIRAERLRENVSHTDLNERHGARK